MFLKQYIQCCNAISFTISALLFLKYIFCSNSRNKGPINIFVIFIYGLNLIFVISQYINFRFCSQDSQSQIICIATWISFTFSIQSQLSFITVLTFSGLYFLSTRNNNFLLILKNSASQLSLISIIIPFIVNISPVTTYLGNTKIVFEDQFNLLNPVLTAFQIITFIIPVVIYLLLISLFSILSVLQLKSDKISLYFQKKLRFSIILLLSTMYLIYVPFIMLMLLDIYQQIFGYMYQFYLGIVNLAILIYIYIYTVNKYLDELVIIKLTYLGKLQLSKIDSQLSQNSKCSEIESVRIQYKM